MDVHVGRARRVVCRGRGGGGGRLVGESGALLRMRRGARRYMREWREWSVSVSLWLIVVLFCINITSPPVFSISVHRPGGLVAITAPALITLTGTPSPQAQIRARSIRAPVRRFCPRALLPLSLPLIPLPLSFLTNLIQLQQRRGVVNRGHSPARVRSRLDLSSSLPCASRIIYPHTASTLHNTVGSSHRALRTHSHRYGDRR